MTHFIDRRKLLTLPSIVGFASALPNAVHATPEDPILPIYEAWHRSREEWTRLSRLKSGENFDTPQMLDLADTWDEALFRLVEMTPISMAGVAALAHVYWDEYGPCFQPGAQDFEAQCGSFDSKLIAAIWRGASGRDGLPRPS